MTTPIEKLNVPGLGRLPAFCHATVAGDFVFVSGTLGTRVDSFELVEGGTGPQTARTLENIARILAGAGAEKRAVVKVNVFLTDMFFADDPPARITVGCSALALGAAVEIDCIAYRPEERGPR